MPRQIETDLPEQREVRPKKENHEREGDRARETGQRRELSERQRVESALQRKGDAHDRVLNTPRVEGFDKLGKKEEAEIKDFLAKEHPDRHLNNVAMSEIRYHDETARSDHGDRVLGKWSAEKEKGMRWESGIDVYRPEDGGKDLQGIKDTLSHEVGHDVEHNLPGDTQARWDRISAKGEADQFVSSYAATDAHEDFAESYSWYINHPEELKQISPEKYDYLKSEIFSGREYGGAVGG